MKKLTMIREAPQMHWVGNGFPVRSMFSYQEELGELSPYLLLDYAGPTDFSPTTSPRGVGSHPHRGFETVTIVYRGEVAHRDSTGNGGVIGPGDVQWMTAGAGILHDEFHSPDFSRQGGTLEMIQLWVNLPAQDKMATPGYQALRQQQIPVVGLSGSDNVARVIAGELDGQAGPARTYTPMQVWDLRVRAGSRVELPLTEGWGVGLVVLRGALRFDDDRRAVDSTLVVWSREGSDIAFDVEADSTVLLLSGEPIDEPIAGSGPFVMNSEQQLRRAIEDFRNDRFVDH